MVVGVGVPSHAALLDVISAGRDLDGLHRTHARLLVLGLSGHRFLRSKLSAAYARCSRLHDAHRLLHPDRSLPLFLLNSLLRASTPGASLILFSRALALRSPPPDSRSFAAALRAAAALPSLRIGRFLHAAALTSGLLPDDADALVPNSLVAMYSKCGDLASARHVFVRTPCWTIASWTAIISACGAHGRAAEAVVLFGKMLTTGAGALDAVALTAVLAACAKGKRAEADVGLRVFEMLREGRLGLRPSVEHYTCAVEILGMAGRVEEAEELVSEVDEDEADDALWAALLVACLAHGRLDVAERAASRIYMHVS